MDANVLTVGLWHVCVHRYTYEFPNTSREEEKRKFSPTMEFVDKYLKDMVDQSFPFEDKVRNELTLEVKNFSLID